MTRGMLLEDMDLEMISGGANFLAIKVDGGEKYFVARSMTGHEDAAAIRKLYENFSLDLTKKHENGQCFRVNAGKISGFVAAMENRGHTVTFLD